MKALIVFYSRSGTTRRAANELGNALGIDVEELRCTRYGGGILDWFRAVYDSLTGSLPEIGPLRHNPAEYEIIVVAGPVWASHAAAPLRTFLQRHRTQIGKIAFLLTLGGSGGDKALAGMRQIAGKQPVATLLMTQADLKAGRNRRKLSDFATSLSQSA